MRLKASKAIRPFNVGDRVQLSASGRSLRPRKTRSSGVVAGYSENGVVVRVVFDGQKTPSRLHASLLELVSVASAAGDLLPKLGSTATADAATGVVRSSHIIACLEEIASDHDQVGNLAPDDESRRHHKRSSREARRLADRISLRRDQFALEKKIALGGQRIAQQKGRIARLERLGFDSKLARELLAVFEQSQALVEQRRRDLREANRRAD